MKQPWFVLFAAACGGSSTGTPDAMPGGDVLAETCRSLPHGPHDQACFSLDLGDPARVIAQRSHTTLFGYARIDHTIASATSDDPALFTIGALTLSDVTDNPRGFTLPLTAATAGDGDVVLRDADGAEIDRITAHSRPSDVLALDGDLSAPALVLAGEVTTLLVTTKTDGAITVGTGAVSFTPSGGVTAATKDDAPWLDRFGDIGFFRVAADGAIQADAPDATASVALTAVAASALTTITAMPTTLSIAAHDSKTVAIGASAAAGPVHGPRCTWSNANALTIAITDGFFEEANLGLGNPAVYHYKVEGPAGDYTPICTLPGGLSVTLQVHVAG
ncbi:MAG: hypothetical protein ABI678_13305 [Kofleriaceae bacterium]